MVVTESLKLGQEIAKYSLPALILCKDSIQKGIYKNNFTQSIIYCRSPRNRII